MQYSFILSFILREEKNLLMSICFMARPCVQEVILVKLKLYALSFYLLSLSLILKEKLSMSICFTVRRKSFGHFTAKQSHTPLLLSVQINDCWSDHCFHSFQVIFLFNGQSGAHCFLEVKPKQG